MVWVDYPIEIEVCKSFGEGEFETGYAVETSVVLGGGGGHFGEKGERPGWSDGDFIDESGGADFVEAGEVGMRCGGEVFGERVLHFVKLDFRSGEI